MLRNSSTAFEFPVYTLSEMIKSRRISCCLTAGRSEVIETSRRRFLCAAAGTLAFPRTPIGALPSEETKGEKIRFGKLPSPVLFRGDERTAFRDPAAVYHDGWFHLFFTYVRIEAASRGSADRRPYLRVAWSKSRDLSRWTEVRPFTPEDLNLNYSSPGDVIRAGDDWILCLQTYPRPNGEKYGNREARIWTMRSADLEHWSGARLLRVKGPDVPQNAMGRMIDPYLFADKDEPGKWWCIYKQNGLSMSWSRDLETWTTAGNFAAAENPCVLVDGGEYVLFDSPAGGIGVKRSADLRSWRDVALLKLGQDEWPWAQGRLTAGFVLDLRRDPNVGKAIMFFHGSRYPEEDPRGGFDNFASIGFAWSDDLEHWSWASGG